MITWKSFLTRAASAIVAIALIIGAYYFWSVNGLKVVIALSIFLGVLELVPVLLHKEESVFLKVFFGLLTLVVFAVTSASLSMGALIFALATVFFIIAALLSMHRDGHLEKMVTYQGKAALGFFYMGLLPAFAYRILDQAYGLSWFIFLLAVVFAGDTLAYLCGVLFGKNKIMPNISPKKSWQGSVGGLAGAVLAGYVCWQFMFSEYPLFFLLALAGVAGLLGQCGDFFESLLKRVADVKDSGKIMPGHGGVLDRIDGVLFASPVILLGILILSHLSS